MADLQPHPHEPALVVIELLPNGDLEIVCRGDKRMIACCILIAIHQRIDLGDAVRWAVEQQKTVVDSDFSAAWEQMNEL